MENTVNVKDIRLAKRYSDAIVEVALESNELQKIHDDIELVIQTCSDNIELKTFLENPIVTHSDKIDVINDVFKSHISGHTLEFLKLLIEKNRFNLLDTIAFEYQSKLNEINNVIKIEIISAVEISEDLKSELLKKLEKVTSKSVLPDYQLDESIIGGLVIKIGDKVIDSSLKAKLSNLKKQLI